MPQCPPLGSRVTANGYHLSSSISSSHPRAGDKLIYVVTFTRRRDEFNKVVLQTGMPQEFRCSGAVACMINGYPGRWSLSGQGWNWPDDVRGPYSIYADTSTQFTLTIEFTLGANSASCAASVGYVGWGGIYETWPIAINPNGTLEHEEKKRNERDCPCCEGYSSFSLDLLSLSYNSANADSPAASMGWGWSMPYYQRVVIDPANQDIVYYDGSGSFERWKKLSGNNYAPRYANNYASLTRNLSTNEVFITLKNKVVLTFRGSDGKIVSEVDRNGNTTTYSYFPDGHLSSVSDGEGRSLHFDYGSRTDGQPVGVRQQDPSSGRLTSLSYYPNGRLWQVTSPTGEVEELVYNNDGLLWKKIDPRGKVEVEYTYSNGKVATTTHYGQMRTSFSYASGLNGSQITTSVEEDLTLNPDPNPRTTVQTFDRRSRLVKLVDPLGSEWNYGFYDQLDPYLLSQVVDPNGGTTSYFYDNGNLVSSTNAQGQTTSMSYTEGYLLSSVQRPAVTVNGVLTTYPPTTLGYNAQGNLTSVTENLGGTNHTTTFAVGSDGRVTSVSNKLGQVTSLEYTTQGAGQNRGNLKKMTMPAGPFGAPTREVHFEYNAYDERTATVDAGGNRIELEMDDSGRLTQIQDPLLNQVQYSYLGGLLDFIDLPANQGSAGNARRTRLTYDDAGQVLQVLSKTSLTQETMRVRHEYDGRFNLKKLIRHKRDSSNALVEKAFQFGYDLLDRPIQTLDPLLGVSQTTYDPFCKNYSTRSARGAKVSVTRDSLCRVTEILSVDERRELFYDEWNRLIKVIQVHLPVGRYGQSRFGQARYAGAEVAEVYEYFYDEWDRLLQIKQPNGQFISYVYDLEGRVTQVTDLLGQLTQRSYYHDGRLYQVTASGQVFTYLYDQAGRLSEIQYPASTGIVAKFSNALNILGWDANGRLLNLRYLKNGNQILAFAYSYDSAGNRTGMIETPTAGPAISWSYGYDWLDRLTRVDKDGTTQTVYVYDESDNRIELQMPPLNQVHTYQHDFADRILSRSLNGNVAETFTHDADGNLLTRTAAGTTTNFSWDTFNKLRGISRPGLSQSYLSDAGGIRKTKDNTTRYTSSQGMSLSDSLPNDSISYIQGHMLLGMRQAGNSFWYLSDGLGSVRLVVDGSGTTVAGTSSDEFGVQTSATGPAAQRQHTYVGGLGVRNESDELGLLYMRQRWYDPASGRFLSQDPIGFAGGLNLYGYVGQDPINLVDPEGLELPPFGYQFGGPYGMEKIPDYDWAALEQKFVDHLPYLELTARALGSVYRPLGIVITAGDIVSGNIDPFNPPVKGAPLGPKTRPGPNPCGKRPPNLSPPGAGRRGAFREAKRQMGIPMSQHPAKVEPTLDRGKARVPGRTYTFEKPNKPNIVIREDAAGHRYPDDPSQNRGPHFNDPLKRHYDY